MPYFISKLTIYNFNQFSFNLLIMKTLTFILKLKEINIFGQCSSKTGILSNALSFYFKRKQFHPLFPKKETCSRNLLLLEQVTYQHCLKLNPTILK